MSINIDFIEGVEINGYTMRCGILVLHILDSVNGIRTYFIDKGCDLSDIFRELADHFMYNGDMRNPHFRATDMGNFRTPTIPADFICVGRFGKKDN